MSMRIFLKTSFFANFIIFCCFPALTNFRHLYHVFHKIIKWNLEQIELNLTPLKYSGSFNNLTEAAQKTFPTKIRIVTKPTFLMQHWWTGIRSTIVTLEFSPKVFTLFLEFSATEIFMIRRIWTSCAKHVIPMCNKMSVALLSKKSFT